MNFILTSQKQPTKNNSYLGTRTGRDITEYTAEVSKNGRVYWFIGENNVDAPLGWCEFPQIHFIRE